MVGGPRPGREATRKAPPAMRPTANTTNASAPPRSDRKLRSARPRVLNQPMATSSPSSPRTGSLDCVPLNTPGAGRPKPPVSLGELLIPHLAGLAFEALLTALRWGNARPPRRNRGQGARQDRGVAAQTTAARGGNGAGSRERGVRTPARSEAGRASGTSAAPTAPGRRSARRRASEASRDHRQVPGRDQRRAPPGAPPRLEGPRRAVPRQPPLHCQQVPGCPRLR